MSANQPPPLLDYNVFESDAPLRESFEREGASWAHDLVFDLGSLAGTQQAIDWGFQANANPPRLHTHDRFGNRIDEVEFHPAWHELMHVAIGHGLHALPWREPRPGAHVARAAAFYVWSQVEGGHGCPVSMTYAAVPALRQEPRLAELWEPLMTTLDYDPGLRPPAGKKGVLLGMAMTERQGGSDVRANTTTATPRHGEHLLNGHKWFCSAPMCDGFLVLAQAPGGLSCFLLPRVLPDGARNGFHIERLKDKLGNRSNASSEVAFENAWAQMVGEEGQGVKTIIEMVNHTRLDCVIGSASLMRQAVAQATHHTAHRKAFGRLLSEQPLMVNVLADIAVESEATTLLMMRLARAFDAGEQHFRRIGVALGKFWTCKRAIAVVAEALECHGGNGYVEESILPRLYREAPLNSIWEGSGNVNALDVLRAMQREPESVTAYLEEVDLAKGQNHNFDRAVEDLKNVMKNGSELESRARRLVERMAVVLEASLLLRHGDPVVARTLRELPRGRQLGTHVRYAGGRSRAEIGDRAAPSAFLMRGMIQEADEITHAWKHSPVARVPSGEVVLVTDFDGTLAEIVQDPSAAAASPEALHALEELVPLLADVIVLSSRPPAQLERLVPVPGVRLIGDSGLAIPRHAQKDALDRFNAEASRLLQGIPGAWLEVKPASTAVHFRNTATSGSQMLALLQPLLDGARLEAGLGRRVVEVHARKAGKGPALAALLPSEDPGGVVCFGDDENDRSMFDYVRSLEIPHMCVGVWSPEAPQDLFDGCDLVVHGPSAASALLQEIVDWAKQSVPD